LFTPEFRNRLDATIPFSGLAPEVIAKVVEKFIFQLEAQLADRGVTFELSNDARSWIGKKGYDEKFGARPLARIIQEYIKKPLADELLFGRLENGGTVKVIVKGEDPDTELDFEFIAPVAKRKSKKALNDESGTSGRKALVGAGSKKVLPGPKSKKSKSSDTSNDAGPSVPGVSRKKDK